MGLELGLASAYWLGSGWGLGSDWEVGVSGMGETGFNVLISVSSSRGVVGPRL